MDNSREELERLWRDRLADAKLRLDFARNFMKEVQVDFPLNDSSPDHRYAFQRALRVENAALAKYRRVLRIFSELILEGKVPDESKWRKSAG